MSWEYLKGSIGYFGVTMLGAVIEIGTLLAAIAIFFWLLGSCQGGD